MYLSSITLENFRNYSKRKFDFSSEITLIVGGNGVGKTNILEACFLLATGKSFRAQRIEEMIGYDQELARVRGLVTDEVLRSSGASHSARSTQDDPLALESLASGSSRKYSNEEGIELQVILTRGELQGRRVAKRKFSVDGASRRVSDFVGKLVVVLFRPEDLEIILGSPHKRREYLDVVLSQIDREYRRSLLSYEKVLLRRNKLLDAIRDEGIPRTQLTFWNQLLIKHGQVLTAKRESYLNFVDNFDANINSFNVGYYPSIISESRLNHYAEQEVAAGYTLVGPHKDDFIVLAKGKGQRAKGETQRELAAYGSRGEQRLAVLWLKLAELAFVAKTLGEEPLLLLDDIFSELDEEHREMVLKVIPQQQTLITTTDPRFLKERSGMDVLELS